MSTSPATGHVRRVASISTRTRQIGTIGWTAVIVLVAAMLWTGYSADSAVKHARLEDESETFPLRNGASNVYRASLAFGNAVFGPLIAQRYLVAELDREVATVDSSFTELDPVVDGVDERVQFDQARSDWTVARAQMVAALGETDDGSRFASAGMTLDAMAAAATALGEAATISHKESLERSRRAGDVRDRAELASLVIALLGLGGAALLSRKFERDLTRPLNALRDTARQLADGDQLPSVPLTGPIEMVELAGDFNAMADTIRERDATLSHLAYHDALTGLGNRNSLHIALEAALGGRRSEPTRSVVVMKLEPDDLEDVNGTLGHPVGDKVLVMMAQRISATLRGTDQVFLIGGNKFGVLSEHEASEVVDAAQRIVDAIVEPMEIDGHAVQLGVSVGIALAVDGGTSTEGLLSDADLAMYAAKAVVGNAIVEFSSRLNDAATRRVAVGHELRVAIDSGQLEVHYQPIINLRHGTLAGAEALVRWRHPVRGLLAPAAFIDIAESSGLIVPLGAQVLEVALRDSARWRHRHAGPESFKISVNVSALQLARPSFVRDVEAALLRSGDGAHDLCLELTETALLDRSDDVDARLGALRAKGIGVALDDFGTGYSSLDLIHTLHVDFIKVDRSFVKGISASRELRALVRSVIEIANSYNGVVVAEGVETEEDAATVRELGATLGQGYLFGRAIPADEFERRWLSNPPTPSRARTPAGASVS